MRTGILGTWEAFETVSLVNRPSFYDAFNSDEVRGKTTPDGHIAAVLVEFLGERGEKP